jgi:flagellar basal-body rod modification protein FlgD
MIGKNVSWIDANGVTQSGTVTGASFTSSGPVLSVGNQQIAMSDVASVGTVSSTPPASSTSTDTSGTNA